MSEHTPIRVVLADDHDVVRHGLRVFIRTFPDMTLVGEANNGVAAVRVCQEVKPDLVLIDILMPQMDGVEAIRQIRQNNPQMYILALSSSNAEEFVLGALQAGANGYLLKNATFDDMEKAIRSVLSGRRTLSPEVADVLIHATTRPQAHDYNLTAREQDVLKLMIKGLNNPEIAEQLTVSVSTAKFHISSILAKLGATSRTEAVAIALENHLVS